MKLRFVVFSGWNAVAPPLRNQSNGVTITWWPWQGNKWKYLEKEMDRILVGDWHAMCSSIRGDPTKDESTSGRSNLPNLHPKVQSALNLFLQFCIGFCLGGLILVSPKSPGKKVTAIIPKYKSDIPRLKFKVVYWRYLLSVLIKKRWIRGRCKIKIKK